MPGWFNFDVPPDYANLLDGKEDKVFPKMQAACEQAMEAGADVVCLGSTTMHQAAEYLAEKLPIPDRQSRAADLQARRISDRS